MKRRQLIFDIVMTLLGVALTIGTLTVFGACGHLKDDGSYMTCHYAGVMLTSLGIVLTVEGAARFLVKGSEAKLAFGISELATAILAALIPNTLIPLCMMQTMQCHTAMKPFAVVICIITALTACADIAINLIGIRKSK